MADTKPVDMGITEAQLTEWLVGYDLESVTIGVVASHSALQILHGAKKEGFKTLGIAVGDARRRLYSAFPGAEPDEWLMLDCYEELMDKAEWLRSRNTINPTRFISRISWTRAL